ncbi:MAG: class I SAM-dependent methyltransferase [Candidatus Merdivicinus sp.]
MADLYEYPDIYDERFSEKANTAYREHYQKMFDGCEITDILDCSFGTGNLTFELCELGYQVSGSDLSPVMLKKAEEKAKEKGFAVDLTCCDFRELTKHFSKQFSCVMSTGNALAHVNNEDVVQTLREMDKLVKPGGYLYLDSRNWDLVLERRGRFAFGSPFIRPDGVRINYVQLWDYHEDGTITIHILNAYEENGRITGQQVFDEHLTPFSFALVESALKEMGYQDLMVKPLPYFRDMDFKEIGWYCLRARKPL